MGYSLGYMMSLKLPKPIQEGKGRNKRHRKGGGWRGLTHAVLLKEPPMTEYWVYTCQKMRAAVFCYGEGKLQLIKIR